ncbi:MAG: hypothetical protein GXY34_12305 [Syntrophomonadaceae bacterium]|nr:hypothetical protein [Syntrophomonadaceae bacterium]
MHQLYCVTKNKQYNITPIVGSLAWKSSIDTLGVQLDFEVAFNDDRYFPVSPVDIGSMVILRNQYEIFRGIVVTEDRNGRQPRTYTAFDPAFYLNKSKAIYQFRQMPADQAINKILADFSVPVGNIAAMTVPITKIYSGDTVSDIIKDIISQVTTKTGVKYRMEMQVNKLYIELQQNMVITPTFRLASNLASAPVTAAISNPTRKRSIEEMKNSIKITSDDKVIAEVKDDSLISKYGLLQEVQTADENEKSQARNTAANLLKDLGRIFEENSIEVPGSDDARAGRLISVEEHITGMTGNYLIKDVTHTLKGGIHSMQLSLGVV